MKAKGLAAYLLLSALTLGASAGDFESKTIDQFYGPGGRETSWQGSSDLLRPLGLLFVLAGIAGGTYVLLKRFSLRRPLTSPRNISVIETAYLSPKHTLALVRVRNRILLLGLGEDVRTLCTFSQPEEVMGIEGEFAGELRSALSQEEDLEEELKDFRPRFSRLKEAIGKWRVSLRGGGNQ